LTFFLTIFICFALYLWISDCGVSPFRCGDYPVLSNLSTQKIAVGSGPEDFALDHSQGYPRIIVSCDERRVGQPKQSGFYGINPNTNQSFQFRIEPANLNIHPHGIDIVTIDSITYLYAISHEQNGANWRHPVYRFEIKEDRLILDENLVLEHDLMNVPNDLTVLSDGSFYATNYVPNMEEIEQTKAILGGKNGSIVYYDGKGNWEIVAKDLCFPNGIWVDEKGNYLYTANGACHEILRFEINEGALNNNNLESTIKHGQKITLGDNLMVDKAGNIWAASHPCPLDFMAHMEDGQAPSPSQIFVIDPSNLKPKVAFQNNGALISAASTALYLDGKLYISQIFEPYVLVVNGVQF
jgi:hypothetical protein